MKSSKSVVLLRIAFIAGAVVDAIALLPMLIPTISKLMWGFDNIQGDYSFAMRMGASLMSGWTILLVWAAIKPMERRPVALFTVFVILGIVAAEIFSVTDDIIKVGLALPSFIMQTILTTLFLTAYIYSRKEMKPDHASIKR